MEELSRSELLFYGGIALMVAAAALAILALIVFRISGCRLRKKLEQEYGKRRH